MKIRNHRLFQDDGTQVPFVRSPNQRGALQARYLVMHYTAGRSADNSIRTLTDPKRKASAHLVIGRDGSVTQLVAFNRVAWHAGRSHWDGLNGLNQHSIGIEMDNAGKLEQQGGRYVAWFGDAYPESEVMLAAHKNEPGRVRPWHTYSPAQIATALAVGTALVDHYGLKAVLGHEDISPERKVDPGPAFPLASFASHLLGRRHETDPVARTATTLNIRTGPGTQHAKVEGGPLPKGTRVRIERQQGRWSFVEVLDAPSGEADLEGWVASRYLAELD